MVLLINLLVFLLILIIVWKIFDYAIVTFGAPVGPQVKTIIGLIFLLIFLVQALGLFGFGTPIFIVYR